VNPVSSQHSNYDLHPRTHIELGVQCHEGWEEVIGIVREQISNGRFILCIEGYPGAPLAEVCERVTSAVAPSLTVDTETLFRPEHEIDKMLRPYLGDDPVFGRLNAIEIADFFDAEDFSQARERISQTKNGVIL
jgi:hypothetical protein